LSKIKEGIHVLFQGRDPGRRGEGEFVVCDGMGWMDGGMDKI
jgi:hypothetical protein